MGSEYTTAQRDASYRWKEKNKAKANESSRKCMRRKYEWDRISKIFYSMLIEEKLI